MLSLFAWKTLTIKPFLAQQGTPTSAPVTAETWLVESTSFAGTGSGSTFIPAAITPAIERLLQVGQDVAHSTSPGF